MNRVRPLPFGVLTTMANPRRSLNVRRQPRRHLRQNLVVRDRTTGRQLGYVGDLTVEGLLLVGDQAPGVGDELDVEVVLPEGFAGESLTARAVVQWRGQDVNPTLHSVGLRFLELGLREQVNIELLIKLVGFRDA